MFVYPSVQVVGPVRKALQVGLGAMRHADLMMTGTPTRFWLGPLGVTAASCQIAQGSLLSETSLRAMSPLQAGGAGAGEGDQRALAPGHGHMHGGKHCTLA